jgi:hypothetical protein
LHFLLDPSVSCGFPALSGIFQVDGFVHHASCMVCIAVTASRCFGMAVRAYVQ